MSEKLDIESPEFYRKLRKRNKEAFHILYEEFKVPLYNLVFSMVRDNEKAADIIQDTFIKIMKKSHQLQEIKKIKHWIFRIAVNLTINFLNKEKKLSWPGDELKIITDKMVVDDFIVGESKEDFGEVRYLILKLVERLPVKQRVVFNMKYIEGFKEAEIGDILDIPVGTVKSRLNTARNRVKKWLKEEMSRF